jgi:glutamate-1-semialdehyde aminotransferase
VVKLARAYTGREAILSYGYHGFGGTFASPPTDYDADDNRRGSLQAQRDNYVPLKWLEESALDRPCEFSAIIVECPPVDGGRERATEWLNAIADYAHRNDALFILDEVVTGFRYGPDGAAGYYQLGDKVDLCCFGKTIGNGQPISALVGQMEIMELLTQGVHYSATFFGHPFGLASAIATMRQLQETPPWSYLYRIGEYLKEQWSELDLLWKMSGHPTRPILEGPDKGLDDLRRHCFARGHIIVKYPWFVSTATTKEDVDSLIEAVKEWQS